MATYYERNKERLKEYQREYHQKNKEANHAYAAYYFQNVTKYMREVNRKPRKKKEKPYKTTITYNSGMVTEKRIRYRKPVEETPPPPSPPPGPVVFMGPPMLLDWNNL